MRSTFKLLVWSACITSCLYGSYYPLKADLDSLTADPVQELLNDTDPLLIVNRLIKVTERALQSQKQLYLHIEEYLTARKMYYKDSDNQTNIDNLVTSSAKAWGKMQETQLFSIFPAEFIEELSLFAHLSYNQSIARP